MSRRIRLVILGDSVSAGYRLPCDGDGLPASCYTRLLQQQLAAADCDVDVIVSALDGTDTCYALRRFSRMVTLHEPHVVAILLGLNDARPPGLHRPVPPDDYAQNMLALVDRVRAIEARPVLVTPNPRFDQATAECMEPYVDVLHGIAAALRIPLIEVYERFLTAPQLTALVPDGVHPSIAGHQLIANVFGEQFVPLISALCHGEPSPHWAEQSL